MNIRKNITGVQHIGIPTNDIEKTVEFYQSLGFEIALRTVNEAANEKVAFLQLGNLVIETYENRAAALRNGAIDHIALDVKNIDEIFEEVRAAGYRMMNDTVQSLPFWEHGVKFFTIAGPNEEKIEFCEKLA
ncbi:VOC family protein [Phocaeicola sp.]